MYASDSLCRSDTVAFDQKINNQQRFVDCEILSFNTVFRVESFLASQANKPLIAFAVFAVLLCLIAVAFWTVHNHRSLLAIHISVMLKQSQSRNVSITRKTACNKYRSFVH